MRVAALVPGVAPLDHGRLHESRQSGSGALAGLYILGLRARHFSCQCGRRLSKKACTPSLASSVEHRRAKASFM